MKIAVFKEIKPDEYRVSLTPNGAKALISRGHHIFVESQAGLGAGFTDKSYQEVGCSIESDREYLSRQCQLILKVKEPLPEEFRYFQEHHILFSYLHLAANPRVSTLICQHKLQAIAYESVMLEDGTLPLLIPMSEIAGKLAVQEGAKYLEKPQGGRGILLGGVTGVAPAHILILGGGIAGQNACEVAIGMGASVRIIDINEQKLSKLHAQFPTIETETYSAESLIPHLQWADLVIGTVLIPNKSTPKLIKTNDLKEMKPGSVIVDVAVDQGGCCETTIPTTHQNPVYCKHGVWHYAVSNMPGAVPITSTLAMTQQTLPFIIDLADYGIDEVFEKNSALKYGLTAQNGRIVHPDLQ